MKRPSLNQFLDSIEFVSTRRDPATGFRRLWGYFLDLSGRHVTFWMFQDGPFGFKYADTYVDRTATIPALTEEKMAKGYRIMPKSRWQNWGMLAKAYNDYMAALDTDGFYQGAPLSGERVTDPARAEGDVLGSELTPEMGQKLLEALKLADL
jgi:hypothetical protein